MIYDIIDYNRINILFTTVIIISYMVGKIRNVKTVIVGFGKLEIFLHRNTSK